MCMCMCVCTCILYFSFYFEVKFDLAFLHIISHGLYSIIQLESNLRPLYNMGVTS